MLSTADHGGTPLVSVRLAADSDAGVVDVMLMGIGPFPILAWRVPRVLFDQLLAEDSAALIQCHAETLGVGIHYPEGHYPLGRLAQVAETPTDPVS